MSAIINALAKILAADPTNWENRQALVEAYWSEGRRSEARMLLNEVQELPADEDSLIAAAQCWALAGSPEDGCEILRSVLQSNPASAKAHLALAVIAHRSGDSRTAMRHYITATSLDSSLSEPDLDQAYGGLLSPAPAAQSTPEVTSPSEPVIHQAPAAQTGSAVSSPNEPVVHPAPAAQVETKVEESAPPAEPPASRLGAETTPALEPDAHDHLARARFLEVPPLPVSAPELSSSPEEPKLHRETPPAHTAQSEAPLKPVADSGHIHPEESTPPPSPGQALKESETLPEPKQEVTAGAGTEVGPGDGDPDLNEEIKKRQEELEAIRNRQRTRDRVASLTVTILLHVLIALLLGLSIATIPRPVPPQIVANSAPLDKEASIETEKMLRPELRPVTAASASATDILSSSNVSSFAVTAMSFQGTSVGANPANEMEFGSSMNFGSTMETSSQSMMLFGQKMEGEVLGVILDVSGSMAEYLPLVIREVDRNLKNAPIVYVNHAGIVGQYNKSAVYPVISSEVLQSWPRDWGKGNSPYWFLWGDLPRKAPQRAVERLIETFKTRPNMFIVRGGNNMVGSAVDFLITQGIDALYIFSDFEDYVDEQYCEALGDSLGKKKVKAYVQPAAAKTEHLWTVTKKIARRTRGRELQPLTEILRPQDMEPDPIGVVVTKETPIPEGVKLATVRKERDGAGVFYNYYHDAYHKQWYGQELKVVQYPNFDIVLRGPEARAYIYMKTKDGYIQNPITFGYHSYKQELGKDNRLYTRKRNFLRHAEEPKFENGEFTWKMILEDEILFEVIFWFKEDSATATYVAQKPPNGEADGAYIYFVVPPLARESKDLYYSVDFPGGISLENLRIAMTKNIATFDLPVQAQDQMATTWSRLGFKKGANPCRYNVIFRDLPSAVREVTVGGPSFGPRQLLARTTSNKLLLSTGNRADMELWEGFACRLARPADRRERVTKTEAIEFSVK